MMPAVTVELHHVFASVGARSQHQEQERFINDLSGWVLDVAVEDAVALPNLVAGGVE